MDRKLSVLQIRSAFDDSGPATQALTMGMALRRRGHTVRYACSGGVLADEIEGEGFPLHRVRTLALDRRDPFSTIKTILALRRILDTHAVDVIHGLNAAATYCAHVASLLSPGRRRALTHSVHGLELRPTHQWRNWIYRGYPATMFATSQFTKDWLLQIGAPAERIVLTFNGVDLAIFSRERVDHARIRAEFGIRPDEIVIGHVGAINGWKGQDMLVRAVARLRDKGLVCRAVLVGDGPVRASVESLATDLGIRDRVITAGFRRDTPEFQAAFDIYSQPSTRGEMFPISILEAMAMGNPWVGSAISGLAELTEDGQAGWVVAPGDVEALSDRYELLVRDRELRTRMGLAGRRAVEQKYSIDKVVDRIEDVYLQLLGEQRRALEGRRL